MFLIGNDLLSNNVPNVEQIVSNAKTPVGGKGRGKNFRDEEDILLVSAWLNVDMDPMQGVDQSNLTYWKRIHKYFHRYKTFESDRTEVSLLSRWSAIQHDVNIFCGCITRIECRNNNGWSTDDKIASACTMFKAEEKKKRNFAFMHCWKILKDKPKWIDRCKQVDMSKIANNKKRKAIASSPPNTSGAVSATTTGADGHPSEANNKKRKVIASSPPNTSGAVPATTTGADGHPSESALERPSEKKRKKQKLGQRSRIEAVDCLLAKKKEIDAENNLKVEERCNKAFALQEGRLKLEEERIKLEKEKFE